MEYNFAGHFTDTPDFNFMDKRASITDRLKAKNGFHHIPIESELKKLN